MSKEKETDPVKGADEQVEGDKDFEGMVLKSFEGLEARIVDLELKLEEAQKVAEKIEAEEEEKEAVDLLTRDEAVEVFEKFASRLEALEQKKEAATPNKRVEAVEDAMVMMKKVIRFTVSTLQTSPASFQAIKEAFPGMFE